MPSLKDIKTRINSVKNTAKITNAMKLVSAAKFARASHAVSAARPYSRGLDRVTSALVGSVTDLESPLLNDREEKRALVVILATDRGLCGGLNNNLFKQVSKFIAEKKSAGVEVELAAWGRRAASFSALTGLKIAESKEHMLDKPNYNNAADACSGLVDWFTDGQYDRIYMMYSEFKSALSQLPRKIQLLPVPVDETNTSDDAQTTDYTIEPSAKEIFSKLLERRLNVAVFQALLEAAASEHGARMTAMDSATSNAKEVNRKLTLQYNRARQAAITTELVEITAGAEAL